jgi:DNA invertase Pin-like site-specific DNA recombinase
VSWPADLTSQVFDEFGSLEMFDVAGRDFLILRRSGRAKKSPRYDRDARGRFLKGGSRRKRGSYASHARDARYVEMKRMALAQLGKGRSARAVARELGINRATVCRWASEEKLVLRRGGQGIRWAAFV